MRKMIRVLIVDDALMMRKIIAKIVEDKGYLVVGEAANGDQAIEMYEKYLPDVVTMDITMPVMDGIQALSRIIAHDANAKVIMVSALGQQHKVMEALDAGAKGYILKPITKEKIITVIEKVIGADSCSLLAPDSIFESGEKRNQENCDAAFLPFSFENKEGCCSVTIQNKFACGDFSKLMTTMEEISLANPVEIIFNFIHKDVLHSSIVSNFIEIMGKITAGGKRMRVICYNQDYMNFFRNVPTLVKVDFTLVKKI